MINHLFYKIIKYYGFYFPRKFLYFVHRKKYPKNNFYKMENGNIIKVEPSFSIESLFLSAERLREANMTSKNLSLTQKGLKIAEFSLDLIDKNFEEMHELYSESDLNLILPEEFDPRFVQIIVHYFYCGEVKSLDFHNVFEF